ncbi:MAG TPA: hypothetical protein VNG32_00485 [Candidatus Dormibacteraeota bacterium]|nr:hypothetical protein [Candidatus Dormibacteraeota bacterium]
MSDTEALKDAIEYIFGYNKEEKGKGEFNSFNRHPEYITIQDITKKHTTGKSYHAIEKELLALFEAHTSTLKAAYEEKVRQATSVKLEQVLLIVGDFYNERLGNIDVETDRQQCYQIISKLRDDLTQPPKEGMHD